MRRGALAALALAALPAPAHADGPWHAGPAKYGVIGPVQQLVAMSDGVKLAVDVYRPAMSGGRPAPGRFPVILSQTPYGKRSATTTQSMAGYGGDGYYPYLVEHGYIDVVADVRGTGSSDGDFSLFGPREMQDGVELANWAASLPGSSGRVGLAGSSYVGLNQIYTAALAGRGSPVKAIVPSTVGNDLYRDLVFGGGIPNLEFDAVWEGLRTTMTAATPDEPDPKAASDHLAGRAMTLAEFDSQLYAEGDTGGPRAFDSEFWLARAPRAYLDRVVQNGVPAMLVSGWHDVYQRGAVLDYAGFQNAWSRVHGGPGRPAADSPPMTANQRPTGRYQLVAGPWFHDPTTLGLRFQQIQLAWFDRWLKGIRDGIDNTTTPLHVFELGANRWINLSRWPLPETHAKTLYLDAGSLATKPAATSGADQLPWSDTRSPCNAGTDQWTTGLPAYAIAQSGGSGDPCADDDRSAQAAALTYTSASFQRATTLAGPIDATVYLSSTRPDAEIVATVEVVAPDGSSRPLGTGALLGSLRATDQRLSWRQDGQLVLPWHPYTSASARDLATGATERLDVEVFPAVARIAAGDRLRLTVTSGDTALQPSSVQASRLAGGVYSIDRGGSHPSSVTLPIAPSGALRTSSIDWGGCNGSC